MAWLVDKARNVGAVRAAAAVTAGGFKLDGGGWRFQGAILIFEKPSSLPIEVGWTRSGWRLTTGEGEREGADSEVGAPTERLDSESVPYNDGLFGPRRTWMVVFGLICSFAMICSSGRHWFNL